ELCEQGEVVPRASDGTGGAAWALAHHGKDEGRRTKDEGRRTKDEGQRTKDEGRRTKDEGRRTKDEGRRTKDQRGNDRATFPPWSLVLSPSSFSSLPVAALRLPAETVGLLV